MTLSDEKLKELEKALVAFNDTNEINCARSKEWLEAALTVREAARAFSQIVPLLKEFIKAHESREPYGKCPFCNSSVVTRERRPDGNDKCSNGHVYPASKTIVERHKWEATAANTATEIGRIVKWEK